jgi:hypothetical protein
MRDEKLKERTKMYESTHGSEKQRAGWVFSLTRALGLSSLLLLTAAFPGQAASIIVNGNFSQTTPPNPTTGFRLVDGSGQLTGWTFAGAIGCLVVPSTTNSCGPGNNSLWTWQTPPDGSNFVALDSDAMYVPGSISQTVAGLTVGGTYTLSFIQASGQFQPLNGPTTEDWLVTFGSQTQTSALMTTPSEGFTGWFNQSMTFTATSATEVLTFLAQGTPIGAPPTDLIADISFGGPPTSTPEPTTYVSVLVGLGGLIALRGRQKRRG